MQGAYGKNYGKPAIGTTNLDSMTYRDLLSQDRHPVPAGLEERGNYQPPPRPVPYEYFYDPKYTHLEREKIWKKRWQLACREEDIPQIGDRIDYNVADLSFFVVRVGESTFKAFYNACPHRGRTLCDHAHSDKHIQCPFHGWTWELDGSIKWVPAEEEFPPRDDLNYNLSEVRVECWNGNVFINPDPQSQPLAASLGILQDHFKAFPCEDRYTLFHVRKKLRANWKISQDAFQEAYHVIETHWDALPFFGDTQTQYNVWDDKESAVSRLITPTAISGHMRDKIAIGEALEQIMSVFFDEHVQDDVGDSLLDARRYIADHQRKVLNAATGLDYSTTADTVLIDYAKYFMFPNHHPWMSELLPIWYRFLPLGTNPEESIMEIRFLAPIPSSGERPLAPKPIDIDFDDLAEGIDEIGILGRIIDQDLGNIPHVQRGMHAVEEGRDYPILARYQESQMTYFYEVYEKLLEL